MTNRYEFMAFCSGLAFCTLLLWGNPSWPYVGILAMSLVLLTVFFLLLAKIDKMELFNKGRFSNWLAVQELNELRTIDLNLLAVEQNLVFF